MSAAHLAEAMATRCESCDAPLDAGQRYCIHCGRRRPDVEEPALGWLAARKARVQAEPAPAATTAPVRNPLALPALALLLLPVVAAAGVLVGRGGDGTDPRVLQALRSQKAPIVRVGDVAAAGTSTSAANKSKTAAKKAKTGRHDASGGKVLAKTRYGVAHEISSFKPTKAKVNSDGQLVQKINQSIGKNYLQAQKDLPDTIVVPSGTPGGTSPGAQGRGD
jgi:hypothetical protein